MYKCKLGMELHKDLGLPYENQISLLRETGFDGFFAYWEKGMDVADLAAAARREGMIFQSLHAPGGPWARYLWYPCEETPTAMELFVSCLRDCAEQAVPIMVLHSFYGFDLHTPTPQGLENFEKIVEQARRLGVKIAFENLEGEEYLAALLAHFRDETAVGFCWDSGHESCYSHRDLLSQPFHGEKLLATHLNDNLGARDFGGARTGADDLHLLPFDGIIDWQDVARRLNQWGFQEMLMFELKPYGQPGRHESDAYARMSPQEYAARAYMRCCRVAALFLREKENRNEI